jgi:hypothetical protein
LHPSNGSQIVGDTEPGATVIIVDDDGNTIPGCEDVTADENGRFSCRPTTPLEPGDRVTAVARDPAGNTSGPSHLVVVALGITVDHPSVARLTEQVVHGFNFNPGEQVCLTVPEESHKVGCVAADDDGHVTHAFQVPASYRDLDHVATLNGEQSGSVSGAFQVTPAAAPVDQAPPSSARPAARISTGGEAASSSIVPRGLVIGLMIAAVGVGVGQRRRRWM